MTQNEPTLEELAAALAPRHLALCEAYFKENLQQVAAAKVCGYSTQNASRIFSRPDMQAYIRARIAQHMTADEVLHRLSAIARTTGDQFVTREEYEVPVYDRRPLADKISGLNAKIQRLREHDPELMARRIERLTDQVASLEVDLALDPEATYQVQVGTVTKKRIVPSLEAAAEAGALFALESAEYTKFGLKFKRQDNLKALELMGKAHALFTDRVEHGGQVGVVGIDFIMPDGEADPDA